MGLGMTDETTAARPPAGWLLDTTTGQTRWWDGAQWTEHVKPAEPRDPEVPLTRAALRAAAQERSVARDDAARAKGHADSVANPEAGGNGVEASAAVHSSTTASTGSPAYGQASAYAAPASYRGPQPQPYSRARQPLTSKNGPAKASLILILLLVLGVGAIVWLLSGQDPALALLLGLVNIGMVLAAFVLAIIGLVIAIRRPTKKRESIFGLVVSSLMLIFLVVRLAMVLSVSVLDAAVLESQIATWAGQQTSETFQVDCPAEPSATAGTVFTCAATGNAGTAWTVQLDHRDWTATGAQGQSSRGAAGDAFDEEHLCHGRVCTCSGSESWPHERLAPDDLLRWIASMRWRGDRRDG